MPIELFPYVSPHVDYQYNYKKIYDYLQNPLSDCTIICREIYDWKKEKLEEILQEVCKQLDIDLDQIIFLSPGIYYSDTKIQFKSFRADQWLMSFVDNMPYSEQQKSLEYHFLSMTNRPTWDRLCVASWLYKHYRTSSKLKFPLHQEYISESMGIDAAFAKYYKIHEYMTQIFDFLIKLPVDDVNERWTREELLTSRTNQCQFHSADLYSQIAVEIVNTTNLTNVFHCDEKIARPIAYCTPFVVMAAPNFLQNLRTLGFKTFGTVWDESYDKLGGKDRLQKIYEVLHEIGGMDLQTLHKQTQEICVYNKSLLYSKAWQYKFKDIH